FQALTSAGFVYMGLTQETATRHPMRPLRALIYAIAVFVFLLGALLVRILVFGEARSFEAALATLIRFALPSIGVIAFLMITEADYRKAWVLKGDEKQIEWAKDFEDRCDTHTVGI